MERTATLVFDEYPDDEIVVRLAPVAMEDYFGILEALEGMTDTESVRAAFTYFARVALVSWTFPEPADADGMLRRDFALAQGIAFEWAKAVRTVVPPLLQTSSVGGPSPARKASRSRRR